MNKVSRIMTATLFGPAPYGVGHALKASDLVDEKRKYHHSVLERMTAFQSMLDELDAPPGSKIEVSIRVIG